MTAQVGDTIYIGRRKYQMAGYPGLPRGNPRVRILTQDEFREQRAEMSSVIGSTACFRNYIGAWKIKGGKLYLTKLEGMFELIGVDPLLAEWFTGTLRVPDGGILHYIHLGFETVFEKDIFIKVKKGVVVKQWAADNRGKDISWWKRIFRNRFG